MRVSKERPNSSQLFLHIPVIHRGYIELFKAQSPKVSQLWVMDEDIIALDPLTEREMRRLEPKLVVEIVSSLNIFDEVKLVGLAQLSKFNAENLVIADDRLTDIVRQKYFPKTKVRIVSPFLRWDEKNVQKLNAVKADEVVSQAKFDHTIMKSANELADKSSDWFRQVGAVIVKDGKILFSAFNQRLPNDQSQYADGDPRNFVALNTDTHQRAVLHAEQSVIAQAAQEGISLKGTSLYVTTFPCPDCASLIAASGIKKCFYQSGYSSLYGEQFLKDAGVRLILVEE